MYRAVSPHGHVYWEIDPNYVLLNQQQQQHAQQQQPLLLEEHLLQQQHYLQQQQQLAAAESSGADTNSSRESSARFSSSNEQRPLISSPVRTTTAEPFVRTGASRFGSRLRPQAAAEAASSAGDVPDCGKPSEQLQTQVQIKDCKALKVQVKSSEYIEAKIRTLRRNNNVALNN